jgi:hypothetical protein
MTKYPTEELLENARLETQGRTNKLRELNAGFQRTGNVWRARLATQEEITTAKNKTTDALESPVLIVPSLGLAVVFQPIRKYVEQPVEEKMEHSND